MTKLQIDSDDHDKQHDDHDKQHNDHVRGYGNCSIIIKAPKLV